MLQIQVDLLQLLVYLHSFSGDRFESRLRLTLGSKPIQKGNTWEEVRINYASGGGGRKEEH
ncbi:hypothetical protein Ocin01_11838 [Orchesella cincta]|uniref:Uncharacterized protein n=1 Tax=Orchesella cincta TaxID=48709 RepID=A0A1D2MP33_ORCCI|nr:hypothetical protein Ocin01_11838 [Orchesella cincta]